MAKRETPAQAVIIDYICDKCSGGTMQPNGKVAWLSDPIQYPHQCSNCGHEHAFTERYPMTTFRPIPTKEAALPLLDDDGENRTMQRKLYDAWYDQHRSGRFKHGREGSAWELWQAAWNAALTAIPGEEETNN